MSLIFQVNSLKAWLNSIFAHSGNGIHLVDKDTQSNKSNAIDTYLFAAVGLVSAAILGPAIVKTKILEAMLFLSQPAVLLGATIFLSVGILGWAAMKKFQTKAANKTHESDTGHTSQKNYEPVAYRLRSRDVKKNSECQVANRSGQHVKKSTRINIENVAQKKELDIEPETDNNATIQIKGPLVYRLRSRDVLCSTKIDNKKKIPRKKAPKDTLESNSTKATRPKPSKTNPGKSLIDDAKKQKQALNKKLYDLERLINQKRYEINHLNENILNLETNIRGLVHRVRTLSTQPSQKVAQLRRSLRSKVHFSIGVLLSKHRMDDWESKLNMHLVFIDQRLDNPSALHHGIWNLQLLVRERGNQDLSQFMLHRILCDLIQLVSANTKRTTASEQQEGMQSKVWRLRNKVSNLKNDKSRHENAIYVLKSQRDDLMREQERHSNSDINSHDRVRSHNKIR
tara:strand:+ start:24284 stop:25648 length:1365 start_codon:yes stop_codon:yes gene_type:complete